MMSDPVGIAAVLANSAGHAPRRAQQNYDSRMDKSRTSIVGSNVVMAMALTAAALQGHCIPEVAHPRPGQLITVVTSTASALTGASATLPVKLQATSTST